MGLVSFGIKRYYNKFDSDDKKRLAKTIYPKGIEEITNISYINDDTKDHLFDIYHPKGKTNLPIILAFHGGGLFYGYKEINKEHYYMLALKGFVVYSFNYRLIPNVVFKDQIKDCFSAYSFVLNNKDKYPGDFNNIFITGDSAGAMLAAGSIIINNDEDLRKIYEVNKIDINPRGLLLVSGMYSVRMGLQFRLASKYYLGKKYKSLGYDKLFDYKNMTVSLPPCYMVTSNQDFMLKQNIVFRNCLERNDIPHFYHQYPKTKTHRLGHIFIINNPEYNESEEVLNEMKSFIEKNLQKS